MTVIGWIQILLFCAVVAALVVPLGGYMTRVFNGERTFLSPVLRPVEAGLYWLGGVDETREQHWITYTVAMLFFHVGGLSHPLRPDALQAGLPFNPAGAVRRGPRPLLQHGRELHHQHQLAELRRRKHAVLPRADARPDPPELSVGSDRYRAGGGADPRIRARVAADDREFLGRYHALHALHPAADLHRLCVVPGLAGHPADARPVRGRDHARRRASRPSQWGRSPRRSRSRCSAPTAAVSSTPMPRIRSRTRRHCRTSYR